MNEGASHNPPPAARPKAAVRVQKQVRLPGLSDAQAAEVLARVDADEDGRRLDARASVPMSSVAVAGIWVTGAGVLGVLFCLGMDTRAPGSEVVNLGRQQAQSMGLLVCLAVVVCGVVMIVAGRRDRR